MSRARQPDCYDENREDVFHFPCFCQEPMGFSIFPKALYEIQNCNSSEECEL